VLLCEVLEAIGAARHDPKTTAERIRGRLQRIDGVSLALPNTGRVVVTKEGAAAVQDCLRYLDRAPSQPVAHFDSRQVEGLALAAADHAADIGALGLVQHSGSDGSTVSGRQSRYGEWETTCSECLWYGKVDGRRGVDIVDDLIVDDGVASRGHRLCIFDPAYTVAGAALARHKVYGTVVVVEFAAAFRPDCRAITARRRHGPPRVVPSAVAAPPRIQTQWQLGACRGCGERIHGGTVVEVKEGRYHVACFRCAGCQCALAGVARVTVTGAPQCKPCWAAKHAPVCGHCSGRVTAGGVTAGGKSFHKQCRTKMKRVEAARSLRTRQSKVAAQAMLGCVPNTRRTPRIKRRSLQAAAETVSALGIGYGDV